MAIDLHGVTINGGAQYGFTSPTYTLARDRGPDARSSQFAVTSNGGTQANVRNHNTSDPFTVTFKAPVSFKPRPTVSVDGIILGNVALNEYRMLLRKGTYVYGTQPRVSYADLRLGICAGADVADNPNIRAMMSLLMGLISTNGQTMGNDLVSGLW